ncbi:MULTISPECIES: septum formation initiator family protein [Anaeromyxobacter]|jgi:cell division protein FtsB|uniref:FtsB family cell division protein n=1 Tax=Anaeromyxobacter TaxID=161492 RepID=UPI001F58144E|nr:MULTISPECIES: septum formation initiator family protein [unclassified Anaeromyxobacter]
MSGRRGRLWGWRAFVGALALLGAVSAVDPDGIRRYVRLDADARRMEDENARLAAENARLAREVHALRTDASALERAAREELRFVRPGERVYWVGQGREAGP